MPLSSYRDSMHPSFALPLPRGSSPPSSGKSRTHRASCAAGRDCRRHVCQLIPAPEISARCIGCPSLFLSALAERKREDSGLRRLLPRPLAPPGTTENRVPKNTYLGLPHSAVTLPKNLLARRRSSAPSPSPDTRRKRPPTSRGRHRPSAIQGYTALCVLPFQREVTAAGTTVQQHQACLALSGKAAATCREGQAEARTPPLRGVSAAADHTGPAVLTGAAAGRRRASCSPPSPWLPHAAATCHGRCRWSRRSSGTMHVSHRREPADAGSAGQAAFLHMPPPRSGEDGTLCHSRHHPP